MQDKSIPDEVRRIMADVFALELPDIGDDSEINELPNWDSGNHIVMVMALEEEFNISFDVSEIETITSFQAVVSAVEQKL